MSRLAMRAAAGLAAAAVGLGALAGCAASDGDGARPAGAETTTAAASGSSSSTASTTTAAGSASTTTEPGLTGLRGVRYCEVLLLHRTASGFSADVWNTMGMSDCPEDQWKALDAKAIAAERHALAAVLNGPRYWTLDSITTDLRKGAAETRFGRIGMFKAATVDLGDDPSQTPYVERGVARDTVFGFDAGSKVYELVAPDGTTYVMQARSQIVDPTLSEADLAGLGDRLDLPDGWRYRVRTLDAPLELASTDGVATVLQDELKDTYQRVEAG